MPPETLVAVANYSLNDEAGRIDQVGKGIESKFYSLRKYNVIAAAFIFSPEIRGKKEVFSFILVLPYSEMSEYLPRHGFCEGKVSRLLQEHLVDHLTEVRVPEQNFQCAVKPVYSGHCLNSLKPYGPYSAHMSLENSHKLMGIYMGI